MLFCFAHRGVLDLHAGGCAVGQARTPPVTTSHQMLSHGQTPHCTDLAQLHFSSMRLPVCTVLSAFFSQQVCRMSQLLVTPVVHDEALKCAQLRVASLGSLVIGRPPPYPGFLEDQVATIQNDLKNKRHVHHLKVTEVDDIIAYAKWEIYPEGRPDLEQLKKPIDEESKSVDQYGRLREAAHEYFCRRNGGPIGARPHIRKHI